VADESKNLVSVILPKSSYQEKFMLVTTDWLAAHLNDPNLRIADVRWYLFEKDKTGQSEYLRGHIPGAVFVDLEMSLAKPGVIGPGRHPIPAADEFAEAMSNAGIDADTFVVAYDDRGGATAARLWWLLRYFGHDKVALLDGGIAQWIAEGRPLETVVPSVPRKNFVAQPSRQPMVVGKLTVDALRRDPHVHIFDVRVGERYRGEIEPIDPKAGHIPGAKNAPIAGNLRSATDLRFLSPAEIRARFEQLGAHPGDPVVAYCGSGINACQAVFALTLAGFENVLLYEGSWSDWSRDDHLPVMTGPNP
jgi:thiosulfate/3-mercaptopyruvate sulfurtransferase